MKIEKNEFLIKKSKNMQKTDSSSAQIISILQKSERKYSKYEKHQLADKKVEDNIFKSKKNIRRIATITYFMLKVFRQTKTNKRGLKTDYYYQIKLPILQRIP